MRDHVSIGVHDLERSRRFYDAALRPLGLVRIVDFAGRGSDYGAAPGMLGVEITITREAAVSTAVAGAHLCFRAPDRVAGARLPRGGARRRRPRRWAAGTKAALSCRLLRRFVLDPDGHRIEAGCHAPQTPAVVA